MEEALNNQVDKMNNPIDVSQILSWSTLVLTEWARECSRHDGRDGGYAWTQDHGLTPTKAGLAIPLLNCQPLSNRNKHGV